jgi:YggT family protein
VRSLVAALQFLLWLYSIALLARLVIEYLRMFARTWQPRGLVLVLVETIFTITDPPLRFVRRFVPPLRLGSINLDLSFLVVFFSVSIASRLLGSLFL